jgi:sugar-specific transcriptional regulator TrmB
MQRVILQAIDEAVETLISLGLTVLQAKVYVALAKLGTATSHSTAKEAKVASQDVYRVLSELQETGLVEKIIAKPNMYHAMPLSKGLSMLLSRRKKQTKQLEKTANLISKEFDSALHAVEKTEIGSFVLIQKEEPIKSKALELLDTAQISLDLMHDTRDTAMYSEFYDISRKLAAREVKVRDLVSKSNQNLQVTRAFIAVIQKHPAFHVKYLEAPTPAKLIIKDNREVLISTTIKPNILLQTFLWSDNPILVQIIQQWFSNIWEKSVQEDFILQIPKSQIE